MSDGLRSTIPAELFESQFALRDERIDELVEELATLNPVAVVAASEWGVGITDQLASRLGLDSNNPKTTRARRDKVEMACYAASAGLQVAAQISDRELQTLLSWYRAHPEDIVVVKPRDSAASDNVFICRNENEVRFAAERILSSTNVMRSQNQSVLMQEYLQGREYVVNTVSRGGEHWLTDVWAVTKRLTKAGRNIYDFDDLVVADAQPELVDYTFSVLDAIGIAVGPGHSEVILTSRGPRLLETGARVTGAANPDALRQATGADQIELTVDCYLFPERLARRSRKYIKRKNARSVHLISVGASMFSPERVTGFLETLPSFHSVRYRTLAGALLAPTVDVATCPGAFFLVSGVQAQIEQDYQAFRAWESENV